jgi:hypothetical protein
VIATTDVERALRTIGTTADFSFERAPRDTRILFVHRRLADGDIYFLNNRQARAERIEARFGVVGRKPEIWRADTGAVQAVSYRIEGEETVVSLELLPGDSYFVVFRKPIHAPSEQVDAPTCYRPEEIQGAWDVTFQEGRGAPTSARLQKLQSLSEHADLGIRYFSGVASYRKTFDLPRLARRSAALMLDLGALGDIAEVRVNGQLLGTLWKPPYQVDISAVVRPSENELEVRVANLWVNRLIGDARPGATQIAFTTVPTYRPDAPLRPSGLMGPVAIIRCHLRLASRSPEAGGRNDVAAPTQ